MIFNIKRKKFNIKGKLVWEYSPIHNLEKVQNSKKVLSDFDTDSLTLDINSPVDIECQQSYDGSTNLIINDDRDFPRIINSGFSLIEGNSYERISRNQNKKTNIYSESNITSETRLQRTTNTCAEVELTELSSGGSLYGGNYTLLFRYADEDDNKTQTVLESGIISIFNGNYSYLDSITGTLFNEQTDKQITITLKNLDTCFSKIYISYKREFCDLNGERQTEYKELEKPYDVPESGNLKLIISGLENTNSISHEELAEIRNTYTKVKTHTQTQNMLFFGNVEETYDQIQLLQSLALYIQVQPVWGESIGYVDQISYNYKHGKEYFDPINIYNNVGYMPEEYYRLGVVFVYNDDSKSFVYNLRGCVFESMYQWSHTDMAPANNDEIDIDTLFIKNTTNNTKGVFKMPYVNLYSTQAITPINLKFNIPKFILKQLESLGIKGYYFVRQTRIPVFLTQGFSIGVSDNAYIPLVGTVIDEESDKGSVYRLDSIFTRKGELDEKDKLDSTAEISLEPVKTKVSGDVHVRGLLCPDVVLNKQLQSMLKGGNFKLTPIATYSVPNLFYISEENVSAIHNEDRHVDLLRTECSPEKTISRELVHVPAGASYFSYKNNIFSTKAGSSTDVRSLRSIGERSSAKLDSNVVRGEFTSFVGVVSEESDTKTNTLKANTVYNVCTDEYGNDKNAIQSAIWKRANDYSEFTSINSITSISVSETVCARGDCFTCTTQQKFSYNFLDHVTPLQNIQVKASFKPDTTKKNNSGDTINMLWKNISEIGIDAWNEINISDVNALDIGYYVSMKYMSNFNHNIRSVDSQNIDEIGLYGSPRQFLPFGGNVSGVAYKIPDSNLHNSGLSATRTFLPHFEAVQVPYINKHFDNRIAFSNIASSTSFSNGYRVFSGMSYQDVERTYGAIVKLLPLGANLFCVFEHGCGIIPVNEKALLSTTQGQSVHLYGTGVLQEQVTVISQDYGSIWENSIIMTPNGIYGVDTWAKKIWKYNTQGFEIISDQLVQSFLNDNITMSESDWMPTVGLKNVKAHYNAYKGDIMFTFYKDGLCWNLCYNERINKFISKYTWTPLLSENIQNSFVSIDKKAVEPWALIAKNKTITSGLVLEDESYFEYEYEIKPEQYNCIIIDNESELKQIPVLENTCRFNRLFTLKGYNACNNLIACVKSIVISTWDDENSKEIINTYVNDSEHGFWLDNKLVSKSGGNTSSKYKVSAIGWGNKNTPVSENNIDVSNFEESIILEKGQYLQDVLEDGYDEDEKDSVSFKNFKSSWSNYIAVTSNANMGVEVKLDNYVNWIKVELSVSPAISSLQKVEETDGVELSDDLESTQVCQTVGDPFTQTICFVANRTHLLNKSINSEEYKTYLDSFDKTLRIGLYTHGKAGIYDEINYSDLNPDNQIKPTFWYNKQEPFEFEFVVNTPSGVQKIFDNLVIISNNVEPESLEISLLGDVYNFNKAGIFNAKNTTIDPDPETGILNTEVLKTEQLKAEFENTDKSQCFDIEFNSNSDKKVTFNTDVERDNVLNQYVLKVHDDCRNTKTWGKRLGNIEYREDKWLVTISPIMFKNTTPIFKGTQIIGTDIGSINSAKLRDKWCKIRVKYKGDKLVVISALQTIMSLSYS